MTADAERGQDWLVRQLGCDAVSLDDLQRLVAALLDENRQQNLIAAASESEVWWRHIVDSAQLLAVSRETPTSDEAGGAWLDLGTGAGFPGLVIAILEPQRRVVLVEERRRRADWLRRTAAVLDLGQVEVQGVALNKVATFPAAVISARAFAPLDGLLHVAARFSTPETLWLLPKGAKARQEVDELPHRLRTMFHVEPSATSPTAGIVVGRGMVSVETGVPGC